MSVPMRTFIAIELPEIIQKRLYESAENIRQVLPRHAVRWIPAENIHLTLKFLGEISEHNLEILSPLLSQSVAQQPPFFMDIQDFGVFPHLKRPRVIWAGIRAPKALHTLQAEIDKTTATLGYAADKRPFSPHLTLGRLREPVSPGNVQILRNALQEYALPPLGSIHITQVTLFKSVLTRQGAIYTPLYHYSLK